MSHSVKVPSRLLTKAEAASYCGVSVATFSALCPVRPVALGKGKRLGTQDSAPLVRGKEGRADIVPAGSALAG